MESSSYEASDRDWRWNKMQPDEEEDNMKNYYKTKHIGRKIATHLFFGICLLGCLWFLASCIDIVAHNMDPNPVYKAWNFFCLVV
jgi:hypothetical protein